MPVLFYLYRINGRESNPPEAGKQVASEIRGEAEAEPNNQATSIFKKTKKADHY